MQALGNLGRCWIVIAVISAGLLHTADSAAQESLDRYDLADAVFAPNDLELIGLPGFTVDQAAWISSDDVLGTLGNTFDVDDRDLEDALETDAELAFTYDTVLALALADSPAQVEIRNTISQFASAQDAENGLAAIMELADRSDPEFGGTWGDHSLVVTTTDALVLAIQVEQMLSFISIDSDYLENDAQRTYFISRLAMLADRSVAKLQRALDRSGPEFGATAIRFEVEEPDRVVATDRYSVDQAGFIPLTSSDTYQPAFMGIQVDAFQIVAAYERFLYPSGLEGAIVNVTLTQHATEDLASLYVKHAQDRLDFGGGYGELREVTNLDLPGDSAVAFSYAVSYTEELETTGLAVSVQIGNQVIAIEVDSENGVEAEDLLVIVEMQVACLTGDTCEPVPYPGD